MHVRVAVAVCLLATRAGAQETPCDGGRTYVDGGDIFQPRYDNNQDCSWLLTCSDPNLAPQVTFTDFHTEGNWDFVYVYDGADISSHI
eukprot:COSAG06_NODE_31608_length_518_cov_1.961814_1_plen_87_part_10